MTIIETDRSAGQVRRISRNDVAVTLDGSAWTPFRAPGLGTIGRGEYIDDLREWASDSSEHYAYLDARLAAEARTRAALIADFLDDEIPGEDS